MESENLQMVFKLLGKYLLVIPESYSEENYFH
jgi:hypothetical protein